MHGNSLPLKNSVGTLEYKLRPMHFLLQFYIGELVKQSVPMVWITRLHWAIPMVKSIHLHPVEGLLYKHFTWGVWFSNGLAYEATLFESHIPSVHHGDSVYHKGCSNFVWKCSLDKSIWNLDTPHLGKPLVNLTHVRFFKRIDIWCSNSVWKLHILNVLYVLKCTTEGVDISCTSVQCVIHILEFMVPLWRLLVNLPC